MSKLPPIYGVKHDLYQLETFIWLGFSVKALLKNCKLFTPDKQLIFYKNQMTAQRYLHKKNSCTALPHMSFFYNYNQRD